MVSRNQKCQCHGGQRKTRQISGLQLQMKHRLIALWQANTARGWGVCRTWWETTSSISESGAVNMFLFPYMYNFCGQPRQLRTYTNFNWPIFHTINLVCGCVYNVLLFYLIKMAVTSSQNTKRRLFLTFTGRWTQPINTSLNGINRPGKNRVIINSWRMVNCSHQDTWLFTNIYHLYLSVSFFHLCYSWQEMFHWVAQMKQTFPVMTPD